MTDNAELRRIVERVRIELAYTRASLGQFLTMADPGRPTDADETRINSVGVLRSRCSDAIKACENLLEKIK